MIEITYKIMKTTLKNFNIIYKIFNNWIVLKIILINYINNFYLFYFKI